MAKTYLITGGAGFIGRHLCNELLTHGCIVRVIDSLVDQVHGTFSAKPHPDVDLITADIRDGAAVAHALEGVDGVFHLAAEVGVGQSMYEIARYVGANDLGTSVLLEQLIRRPVERLVVASSMSVYGEGMYRTVEGTPAPHVRRSLRDGTTQWEPSAPDGSPVVPIPTDESKPIDLASIYQYVMDYAHTFGLRSAVMRMSCIYGPRQFGTEDQGWVAHFLIRALRGQPITVYGDGRQVRDILHVRDAVAAYRMLLADIDRNAGQAFNLGGGPDNAVSLKQVLDEIAEITGAELHCTHSDWRTGDQLYFVADTTRLTEAVGWCRSVGWRSGLRDLACWLLTEFEIPIASRTLEKGLHA